MLTLPALECAHCHKKMRKFAALGEESSVERAIRPGGIAPLVCDKCGELNLLIEGKYCREPSEAETAALMEAPIAPVLRDLQAGYRKNLYGGEVQ